MCERAAEAVDGERNRVGAGLYSGARWVRKARRVVGWSKQTGNVNLKHVAAITIVLARDGNAREVHARVVGFAFLRQSPMRRVN